MISLAEQTAALRHFLPVVEKDDPDGTIAQKYRAALDTMEHLVEKQIHVRALRVLDLARPELKELLKEIL